MMNFYQPSNRFSPLSFLFFIAACCLVIPILSFIYAYAIYYIPFPYINFFITAGFGMGVGIAVNYLVINLGKVRNTTLAAVFGILAALTALYVAWAVWINLIMQSDQVINGTLHWLLNPSALFTLIAEINKVGAWGMFDNTVKGNPLTFVWIVEALIVLFMSFTSAIPKSKEPFCEVNNKWFTQKNLPALNLIEDPQTCLTAIDEGDAEYFKNLKRSENPSMESHSTWVLYANETKENYLSIQNQIAHRNDKDEVKFNDHEFVKYVEISEEISQILEAI